MKNWMYIAIVAMAGLFAMSAPAMAASQDECAIWICAPSGFTPSQCDAAYEAMMERISPPDPESPLPPFHECSRNGGSSGQSMSANYGMAAFVPTHYKCVSWRYWGRGGPKCVEQVKVEQHYVKGQRCVRIGGGPNGGPVETYPPGCTRTKRFIDVLVNGDQVGDTYYWSMW